MKKIFLFLSVLLSFDLLSQTYFPDVNINNTTYSSGTTVNSQAGGIISPSSPSLPVTVNGTANVTFKSGKSIKLEPGFHAQCSTSAFFNAVVQSEVIVIEPNPFTSSNVGKYEKLELGLMTSDLINDKINTFLNAEVAANSGSKPSGSINPYDPDDISVEATFTPPSGSGLSNRVIYGFYIKEQVRNGTTGWNLNTSSSTYKYNWRVRFAPTYLGTWTCSIRITSLNSIFPDKQIDGISFNCVTSSSNGYIANPTNTTYKYLRFPETGEAFFAIGENLNVYKQGVSPMPKNTPAEFQVFQDEISDLKDAGGNYFRMFMAPWGGAIEVDLMGNYDHYQDFAFELDNTFENYCKPNDVYVQLCLEYQTNLNTGGYDELEDYDWTNNPYKNALSLTYPKDFFTSTLAKKYYKNKLRYIISRWGYSTNLAVIESMNEIDIIGQDDSSNPPLSAYNSYFTTLATREAVEAWHAEMFNYIRTGGLNEPNHLLTVSYGNISPPSINNYTYVDYYLNTTYNPSGVTYADEDDADPFLNIPEVDIVNVHSYNYYRNYNLWQSVLLNDGDTDFGSSTPNSLLGKYEKPVLLGEAGPGSRYWLTKSDKSYYHNLLWSTAFMGTHGTALPYDWFNLRQYPAGDISLNSFKSISAFFNRVDLSNTIFTNYRFPQTFQEQGTTTVDDDGIEVFALVNSSETYGWVHNRSHYWDNLINKTCTSYSCTADCTTPDSDLDGIFSGSGCFSTSSPILYPACYEDCLTADSYSSPQTWSSESFTMPGFSASTSYYIHWYSTWIDENDLISTTQETTDGSGNLTVSVPTLGNSSSTDPDYAFIINSSSSGMVKNTSTRPSYRSSISGTNKFKSNSTTGVSKQEETTPLISVYPNPNNGVFDIVFDLGYYNIEIFDVFGKKIFEKNDLYDKNIKVDISDQSKGVYFIKMISENGTNVLRILNQ